MWYIYKGSNILKFKDLIFGNKYYIQCHITSDVATTLSNFKYYTTSSNEYDYILILEYELLENFESLIDRRKRIVEDI